MIPMDLSTKWKIWINDPTGSEIQTCGSDPRSISRTHPHVWYVCTYIQQVYHAKHTIAAEESWQNIFENRQTLLSTSSYSTNLYVAMELFYSVCVAWLKRRSRLCVSVTTTVYLVRTRHSRTAENWQEKSSLRHFDRFWYWNMSAIGTRQSEKVTHKPYKTGESSGCPHWYLCVQDQSTTMQSSVIVLFLTATVAALYAAVYGQGQGKCTSPVMSCLTRNFGITAPEIYRPPKSVATAGRSYSDFSFIEERKPRSSFV